MSSRHLEWAVAGGLAGWAAARLAGADRLSPLEPGAVPVLSFTPQAAAGAWLAAVLLRGRGPSATAAIAGAALTAAVAPRAIPRRQPPADGLTLRVLTANLLVGRAAEASVVDLVRRTAADVLFLQELTDDAATRLKRAGLGDLLPNEITDVSGDCAGGNGIYARYPLRDGAAIAPPSAALPSAARPAARLDLPSGRSVHVACVHLRPPSPPWSLRAAAEWRRQLAMLPPPGDPLVILAGDFNGTVDHWSFRRLLRLGYADAASQAGRGLVPTWGPAPRGRPALLAIDHVLADPRCAVRAASVHRLPGSDHRAVYAELRLPSRIVDRENR
jgi:endonuclease/exonuclease/phosphatase family metal-dependent hydrolase